MGVSPSPDRDFLITDFGKRTLTQKYLLPGESYQDLFARVATANADDFAHAQRMYDYMSRHWFMGATPVLANSGTDRGLPVSCYLNAAHDSMSGINHVFDEVFWLSSGGGGIGTYWGGVREVGSMVRGRPDAEGVIPWIQIENAYVKAVNQGSVRGASAAVYLDIDHPEIVEFIQLRRAGGGDHDRKAKDLFPGVLITDKFMEAVKADEPWDLISRQSSRHVVDTVSARYLWGLIMETRLETGVPYMIFIDRVNEQQSPVHEKLGLKITQSNLCTEIFLPTGKDHHGDWRTAVCCISSVNLLYFDEWKDDPLFIEDCCRFLDNNLQNFIEKVRGRKGFESALISAERARSIGLGVMGFHSYLQSNMIPFGSVMAKVHNKRMFSHLEQTSKVANVRLAHERGPCPDAADAGMMYRFSHTLAIAPTASISIIAGQSSPGIEPYPAVEYTAKTDVGTSLCRNPFFEKLLEKCWDERSERGIVEGFTKDRFLESVWTSVHEHGGSVQHFNFLNDLEKETFKTAFEIDQSWVVLLAAERTKHLDQGQSVNVFFPGDADKKAISRVHMDMWERGGKGLYYLRSTSVVQAGVGSVDSWEAPSDPPECLSCQ